MLIIPLLVAPQSLSHKAMYISGPRADERSPKSNTSLQPKDFKRSVTLALASASLPETKMVWSPSWTAFGFTITLQLIVFRLLTTFRLGKVFWMFSETERSWPANTRGGMPWLASNSLAVSMRTLDPTLLAL